MLYLCAVNVAESNVVDTESSKVYKDIINFAERMRDTADMKTISVCSKEFDAQYVEDCSTHLEDFSASSLCLDKDDLLIVVGFHLDNEIKQLCDTLYNLNINFIIIPSACYALDADKSMVAIMSNAYPRKVMPNVIKLSDIYRM